MNFTGPYIYKVEKGGKIIENKVSCFFTIDYFLKMLFGNIFLNQKCE